MTQTWRDLLNSTERDRVAELDAAIKAYQTERRRIMHRAVHRCDDGWQARRQAVRRKRREEARA